MADARTILWHIEISHYNEKARWALDYKGIPYELRTPMPGLHRATALRITRGKHDRLPIAEMDGEADRRLDGNHRGAGGQTPRPAALPGGGRRTRPGAGPGGLLRRGAGAAAAALRLALHTGRHGRHGERRAPECGPGPKRVMRSLAPVVRPVIKRDYDVAADTAAEAAEGMRVAMYRIESELGSGEYLVGDSFTVADLTAAALFSPRPVARTYPRTSRQRCSPCGRS